MHIFGIFLCAIAGFMLGGLWYSPMLFADAWSRESGTPNEHSTDRKVQARFFIVLVVLLLLVALVLDGVLANWGSGPTLSHGLTVGALGGVLAVAVVGMDTLFERKRLKLFLINAGYYFITFCIMGVILASL